MGIELKRRLLFKIDDEKDEEEKKRMENLIEEWDSLYPHGFACECCGALTCMGCDFYKRVTESGMSDSDSGSDGDGSDDWDWDDRVMFCLPFIGVYE